MTKIQSTPRRWFPAAALCVGLILGGCSSDGDDAASSTTSAAGGDSSNAPTTEAAEAPETGPRTVTHAMGETTFEGPIERLVVLDSSFLDSAIALDVVPVGATEGQASAGLPAYLGDVIGGELDGIELVGLTNEPSLEAIAALAPDAIIGAKVRHEALYNDLSAIAPTAFSENSGGDWRAQVELTGEVLGKSDEAKTLLSDFDTRATEVGTAIGAEGKTANIIRFIPGQIRLYGPGTFSGSVLTAVGFDLGDKGWNEYHMAIISTEQLEMADGEYVFATNPEVESDGAIQSDRGSLGGLWDSLPAVAAGNQYDIVDTTWMSGIGVIGANRILDDLEEWLG